MRNLLRYLGADKRKQDESGPKEITPADRDGSIEFTPADRDGSIEFTPADRDGFLSRHSMKPSKYRTCEGCRGPLKSRWIFADYCPACTPFWERFRTLLLEAVLCGGVTTLGLSLIIYLYSGVAFGFTSPFPIAPVLVGAMAVCWVIASILYLWLWLFGSYSGGGYYGGGDFGGGNGGG